MKCFTYAREDANIYRREGIAMKKINRFIFIKKRTLILAAVALILCAALVFICVPFGFVPVGGEAQGNAVIVIDPGHGGIDGGANRNDLLEKDINLDIAKKTCALLEAEQYRVLMTRQEDVSLDGLNNSSKSRHRRDLNARVDIINGSGADIFISIPVNCIPKSPSANGSVVFYNNKHAGSKELAYCIQRALNGIETPGMDRKKHDPKMADFFLLRNAAIPGVLVETAFISNETEKKLLTGDSFKSSLASAIAQGAAQYLTGAAEGEPPEAPVPQLEKNKNDAP